MNKYGNVVKWTVNNSILVQAKWSFEYTAKELLLLFVIQNNNTISQVHSKANNWIDILPL